MRRDMGTAPFGLIIRKADNRMGILSTLGRSRSFFIQAAVALLCPRLFLRAWLRRHLPAARIHPGTLYGFTLSFDVDSEEDVRALPELIALLRVQGWRASFAVIGEYARRYPPEHRCLAESGHEIINHTQRHPRHRLLSPDRCFDRLAPAEMREEIALCHKTLNEVCGVVSKVFRAPHFGEAHTAEAYAVLRDLGYAASTSEVAVRSPFGGLPYRLGSEDAAAALWEFPLSTCPDHPHAVLDTWHCLQKPRPWHAKPGEMAAALKALFAMQRECGGYVNLYFDPAAFMHCPHREEVIAALRSGNAPPRTYGDLLASCAVPQNDCE